MQKIYADSTLAFPQDDFEKPDYLPVDIYCHQDKAQAEETDEETVDYGPEM